MFFRFRKKLIFCCVSLWINPSAVAMLRWLTVFQCGPMCQLEKDFNKQIAKKLICITINESRHIIICDVTSENSLKLVHFTSIFFVCEVHQRRANETRIEQGNVNLFHFE